MIDNLLKLLAHLSLWVISTLLEWMIMLIPVAI